MSEKDLTSTMQQMMAQMAVVRTELNELKARANVVTSPEQPVKPTASTTRRKMLRRLAGGLLAGLAVSGIGASLPQSAEAKISSNPAGNNLTGRVGMLVVPPGSTVSGNLSGSSKAGLVVGGDNPTFDISKFTPTVNAAILAYTASNGTAIVGQTQTGTGVYGQSDTGIGVSGAVTGTSTNSIGVYGTNTSGIGVSGTSSSNYGVKGVSTSSYGVEGNSTSGIGVVGNSSSSDGVAGGSINGIGVHGLSSGNHGVSGYTSVSNSDVTLNGYAGYAGVYGNATSRYGIGVYGKNIATDGIGILGVNSGNNGTGVYGGNQSSTSNSWAGYFSGFVFASNMIVGGSLSKNSGTFKIDHPLDPENKYLYHSFVESPDMMNIYNGIVTLDRQGEASIQMADWFEALNMDFRYQLTALDRAAPNLHISQRVNQGCFKIAGGLPGQEVSWQVTGIRQDAWARDHRVQVEETKSEAEKGKFIYPGGFGKSEEMSVHPRPKVAK